MRKVSAAIALSLLHAVSNATPTDESGKDTNTKTECPTTGAELVNLKTEQKVLQCFGKPRHETSKPDGLHTGLYEFSNGLTVVFLYDKEGNVLKHQGYRDTK